MQLAPTVPEASAESSVGLVGPQPVLSPPVEAVLPTAIDPFDPFTSQPQPAAGDDTVDSQPNTGDDAVADSSDDASSLLQVSPRRLRAEMAPQAVPAPSAARRVVLAVPASCGSGRISGIGRDGCCGIGREW